MAQLETNASKVCLNKGKEANESERVSSNGEPQVNYIDLKSTQSTATTSGNATENNIEEDCRATKPNVIIQVELEVEKRIAFGEIVVRGNLDDDDDDEQQQGEQGNSVAAIASTSSRSSSSSAGQREQQQQQQQQQWLAHVAAQTHQGVRQRMSQASDQLGHSLRQLYASASSIAADVPPPYHNIPGIVPYFHGRTIGPPPSYDDVINPYAPPPTYHSLFGQMREARKSSRGLLDLLRRLTIILISTLGCTILIAFMILIPFTMIIVGAVYIDECRVEHIPAFLLVGGLVWASKNIIHCYGQCKLQIPPPSVLSSSSTSSVSSSLSLNNNNFNHLNSNLNSSSIPRHSTRDEDSRGGTRENGNAHPAPPATENSLSRHLEARNGNEFATRTNELENNDSNYEHFATAAALATSGDAHLLHTFSVGSVGGGGGNDSVTQDGGAPPRAQRQCRAEQRTTSNGRQSTRRLKSSICESLLNCVLFGWFIAGCIIVFRNYEPDFDNPTSARYCHKTVYMYTFWLINAAILLLSLFISCICCLMVSSAVSSHPDEADSVS